MKDLGDLVYLGTTVDIKLDRIIKIHWSDYGKYMFKTYPKYIKVGIHNKAAAPMSRDVKLTKEENIAFNQQQFVLNFPYQELSESLLYLAFKTSPDIKFPVNACARFSSKTFYSACRTLIIRILDYVSRTNNKGIVYCGA